MPRPDAISSPARVADEVAGLSSIRLGIVNPDSDGDGLTNYEEFLLGTDAHLTDTDGGGRSDGEEVLVTGTDPLDPSDD